jgi:hypothetical protein
MLVLHSQCYYTGLKCGLKICRGYEDKAVVVVEKR